MPDWLWMILLQVFLIFLNAVFAGSEIAVLSVNELKLDKMIRDGNAKAKVLKKLTKDPSRFLSTIQIAITLSGFLGSAFAADNFSGYLADGMARLGIGLPYPVLDSISVILITLILSYFTLVFGELVPKQIAIHKTESMALAVSGLIAKISVVFAPLVKILSWSTNAVLRLLHINPDAEEEKLTEEEILMTVQAGTANGVIEPDQGEIIANVFAFDDLKARDLLTHRMDMDVVDLLKPETWHDSICRSEHSFLPVVEGDSDKVIGLLNTKKYFRNQADDDKTRIQESMEKPYFVYESMPADELFATLKNSRKHTAVILDEYGGVSGLVTMTDLLGKLVGNFESGEELITPLPDGSFRIKDKAGVQEVARALDTSINPDYVNFNGLVCSLIQGIPDQNGQEIEYNGWKIRLDHIEHHRVEDALVTRARPEE